jgi:hypothetical protein
LRWESQEQDSQEGELSGARRARQMGESRGNLEIGISRAGQPRGRVIGGPQSKTDGGSREKS